MVSNVVIRLSLVVSFAGNTGKKSLLGRVEDLMLFKVIFINYRGTR